VESAQKYYEEALKIHREIEYRQGEATGLGNIGLIYMDKGELDSALKYLKEALNILDRFKLVYGRDVFQSAIDSITKSRKGKK
jgi:tetratricopeptide (TPR) repeat protein